MPGLSAQAGQDIYVTIRPVRKVDWYLMQPPPPPGCDAWPADPAERDLYQWLADWERGHQRFLARINQELLEEIWQDSGFWPF